MLRILRWIPDWFGSLPTTTLAGRVYLTAGGAFAIFALASGRNGPLLVMAALIAFVAVSFWTSNRNLRGLTVEREIPGRVRAGRAFTVRLRITNHRRFGAAVAVRVRDALHPAALGAPTLALPVVPPRSSVSVAFRARIRRRGAYRITNAMLATRFPFGLLERRALRQYPSEILVTPRELDPDRDVEPDPWERQRPREVRGSRQRGAEEFLGIREYRSGDNPRAIAWKATARQGRLMIRELDRPRRRRTVVLLDTDGSRLPSWARGPALERSVSLAAGLARRLRARRRSAVLATFDPHPRILRHAGTAAGHRELLEMLAVVRAAPGRKPEDLLDHLDAGLLRGSSVILVSPLPPSPTGSLATRIKALGGRLHVLDSSPTRRPRAPRRRRG